MKVLFFIAAIFALIGAAFGLAYFVQVTLGLPVWFSIILNFVFGWFYGKYASKLYYRLFPSRYGYWS